ncbi:hypothetical protein D3C83_155250 [compost metagenome]
MLAQGRAAALAALHSEAKSIDEKTLMMQYLDTLRAVGSSPSTKFVVPVELTGMLSRFMNVMQSATTVEAPTNGSNGQAPKL